ncbi:efflux RND transporter periplasmic adaptor subunit [Brevundimonas sp.]|uniref:efflux RND transporter periplasmic adaptor subunit n=1 Tax=Brevundimonas sp. TaxID=1871086 RepID=UPI00262C98D3|nr:efflux RND transporter periplasmic adaptor subunit [Brevundimonas sp.]
MLKRHFLLVAAAVLIGLMVVAAVMRIAFAGEEGGQGGPGGGRGGPGGGGQTVAVALVAQREFSDEIRVLGVARGRRSVNITAPASELVTRVMFRDGQTVRAGQPLVELQAREEDAAIIEARARVAQAEREYERTAALAERGIAPRVLAEQALSDLEVERASLQAAQARLGDRVIRAPFAGMLGLTTVTPGTLVGPNAVITTLDDVSVVRVDFPIPERFVSSLGAGTPVTATSDAYGDQPFVGRIAQLDTRIDEATRAVIARAEIPNPGGRIRPGALMRVAVSQGRRTSLAVPEAAVQYEGESAYVFRLAQGERGFTAQRIEVDAGAAEGGFVEILSGLDAGDRVVGSGLNRIQPGAPVTPAGAARPAPAGATRP